jgi:hypothetical protein
MFASLHAWFRQHGQRQPATARRAAPRVEALEDRWLLTSGWTPPIPTSFTYHGGPLLTPVEVQAVYFGPRWSQAAYRSQVGYLDGFLNTIVHNAYLDTLPKAGYSVGHGTALPGTVLSAGLPRQHAITPHQLQQALLRAIAEGRLGPPDANHLDVVFVQPQTVVRLQDLPNFAGPSFGPSVYHATVAGKDRHGHRVRIDYAVVPYPRANGNLPGLSTLDTLTVLASRALVVRSPTRVGRRIGPGPGGISTT